MQILKPGPRPTESGLLGTEPGICELPCSLTILLCTYISKALSQNCQQLLRHISQNAGKRWRWEGVFWVPEGVRSFPVDFLINLAWPVIVGGKQGCAPTAPHPHGRGSETYRVSTQKRRHGVKLCLSTYRINLMVKRHQGWEAF